MGQVEPSVAINTRAPFSVTGRSAFSGRRERRLCGGSLMACTFSRIKLTRRRIPDHRVEPGDDVQPAARVFASGDSSERRSNTDKPADNRKYCQHCQRHPHRRWRLVWHMRSMLMAAAVPVRWQVSPDVFKLWANVLAGLVPWTIS